MTLNTGIFDVSDPQNPDRVYSAALLCRMMAKQIRDGIVHGDGDEMAVTVTDPPAMTVLVGTGTAMVQGRFCENDVALTLAVPTAHATYPRIDRVVVRLNASPGRTIDIVVKPGTAAPTPAAPALTRTAETWELSLARVWVEPGATSILSAKITDERGNASLCGAAAPVYVPSSQLEVVGAVDMQSNALTGLPVPSAGTDAATKAYADSAGIPKISLMQVDADKDWKGREITNLGRLCVDHLSAAQFAVVASDYINYSDLAVSGDVEYSYYIHCYTINEGIGTLVAYTPPPVIADGSTIRLMFRAVLISGDQSFLTIRKNETVLLSYARPQTYHTKDISLDISVDQGDTIDIYGFSAAVWYIRMGYRHAFDNWTATGTPV